MLIRYLQKEFTEETGLVLQDGTEEDVLLALDKIIVVYINHHFEKLLQVMYRMDVDEQKFSKALLKKRSSLEIAKLVISREKQRIDFRKRYK